MLCGWRYGSRLTASRIRAFRRLPGGAEGLKSPGVPRGQRSACTPDTASGQRIESGEQDPKKDRKSPAHYADIGPHRSTP
jgi:hypothetical protein